jgi:peptide/nickel transport system permease protein
MTAYIIRRLLQAVITVFFITLGIFFLMRLIPGDPLNIFFGGTLDLDSLPPERLAELRHEFGLDKSLFLQYTSWLGNVFQGDFGTSIFYRENIGELMLQRFPVTLYLGVLSLAVSVILGVLVGLVAAVKRGTWVDSTTGIIAYLGQAVPIFWLGIVLMYLFGLHLGWLPISGYTSPFKDFWLSTRQIVMPVACLSVGSMVAIMRQMRSSAIEIIQQDYVRTAWAKGLRQHDVVTKHVLRNSLIPVISIVGMFVPMLFGGVVFVETIFAIPGIGLLLVTSIFEHDYQLIQSITFIIAIIVVLTNLLVDLAYGWLDPRVRYN